MQGRLIADPAVRADPGRFADELHARGPMVRGRAAWLTADHALAHQLLRSDDFSVTAIGRTLPGPLGWLEQKTSVKGRLHPLLPPSMLSVEPPEHTRYRKTVSSVFTTRAVAALRDRVQGSTPRRRSASTSSTSTAHSCPSPSSATSSAYPTTTARASWNSVSSPPPASTSDCRGSSTSAWSAGWTASTRGWRGTWVTSSATPATT
jgi:hypothetical protein